MERHLADIFRINGEHIAVADLTNLTLDDVVRFYQEQNAVGNIVVPKRRQIEATD